MGNKGMHLKKKSHRGHGCLSVVSNIYFKIKIAD